MSTDTYAFAPSGRIRLKETHEEKVSRLHREATKHFDRVQRQIHRANANGFATTPPRSNSRAESLTPPRRLPTHFFHLHDDDGGDQWAGPSVASRREEQEKMEWMELEELTRGGGDLYGEVRWGYVRSTRETNIPARHRQSHSQAGPSRQQGPDLGQMTEEEYTTFIANGMQRKRDELDAREQEERKKRRLDAEREEYVREERAREKEQRRAERRAKRKREEDRERMEHEKKQKVDEVQWLEADEWKCSKRMARERYVERWKAITTVGGEIEEVDLRYEDVPWPFYRGAKLEKEGVRAFMLDLAKDQVEDVKKTLREAIRAYHPDRFFGRILPRVKESDRDKVEESVEACSRIINDLASGL